MVTDTSVDVVLPDAPVISALMLRYLHSCRGEKEKGCTPPVTKKPMNPEQIISYVNDRFPVSANEAELLRESSDNQIWKLKSDQDIRAYFLRISKRDIKDDVAFEATWLEILAQAGIPVPPLVRTKSDTPFDTSLEIGTTTLFEEVHGMHLDFGKEVFPNKQQVSSAARMLSTIHEVSSKKSVTLPRQRTILTELSRVEKIRDTLNPNESGNTEFLSAVDEYLKWANEQKLEPVLIHNDYRVGNLLFEDDQVTAVLDFDWSCIGPAIKDLAHALAEWSYPDGADSHNEDVFQTFLDAYNSASSHPLKRDSMLYRWIALINF